MRIGGLSRHWKMKPLKMQNGSVSYPLNAWKFLEGEAPATANPVCGGSLN